MAEELRIVPGKYNPITVTIPAGEYNSEKIYLGSKSIMGMYVRGFSGTLYFRGSITEDGINPTADPDESIENYIYASIQKPEDSNGAEYSVVSGTFFSLIAVDYTVFATPNWIVIVLGESVSEDVTISLQPYDI